MEPSSINIGIRMHDGPMGHVPWRTVGSPEGGGEISPAEWVFLIFFALDLIHQGISLKCELFIWWKICSSNLIESTWSLK